MAFAVDPFEFGAMRPSTFAGQTHVLAESQPQYQPLPVHISRDGVVTSCWELTQEDIDQIQREGVIWLQQLTFGQPLQPQLLLAGCPL